MSTSTGKKDQGLQTSDFDTDDFLSILSENYDDYQFLTSNEGIAKEFLRQTSLPENLNFENGIKGKVPRSKSADEYRNYQKNIKFLLKNIYIHTQVKVVHEVLEGQSLLED